MKVEDQQIMWLNSQRRISITFAGKIRLKKQKNGMYYNYWAPCTSRDSLRRKEENCDVSRDNSGSDIMLRQIVRKLRQRLILYPLSSTTTPRTEPINGALQGERYATPLSCQAWWGELSWQKKILYYYFGKENQVSSSILSFTLLKMKINSSAEYNTVNMEPNVFTFNLQMSNEVPDLRLLSILSICFGELLSFWKLKLKSRYKC